MLEERLQQVQSWLPAAMKRVDEAAQRLREAQAYVDQRMSERDSIRAALARQRKP